MGNNDRTVFTKRIGVAVSESLDGPWQRMDKPLMEIAPEGNWDDCCTTNPAFLRHPNGENWLYFKSWNAKEYRDQSGGIRGNRKYGLAISQRIDGGYERYQGNPIVDFSKFGNNRQVEDAFVYIEDGKFKMLMRDMGYFDHNVGLLFESPDGINWSLPKIAWYSAYKYSIVAENQTRNSFERPQLLMKDGKPDYLFSALRGGKYMTSSGFVSKV